MFAVTGPPRFRKTPFALVKDADTQLADIELEMDVCVPDSVQALLDAGWKLQLTESETDG